MIALGGFGQSYLWRKVILRQESYFFFFKESGPPRDLPPSPPRPSSDLAPPRPVGGALLLLADEPVARGPQARGAMGRPRHPAGLTGNRQTGGRPERAS